MSQDACLKFIGYYNLNKIKYYIGSLQVKGIIETAEVIQSYNRYRLTPLGMSAMVGISGSFDRYLYDWFQKYDVVL